MIISENELRSTIRNVLLENDMPSMIAKKVSDTLANLDPNKVEEEIEGKLSKLNNNEEIEKVVRDTVSKAIEGLF